MGPPVRRRTDEAPPKNAAGPSERGGSVEPAEVLAPPSSRTGFRQRYGVVYSTQGPRIRLGVAWAVAVAAVLAVQPLRPYGLATLYGVVAGAAALQMLDAGHRSYPGVLRWVAALGASTLPVVATMGARPLGGALLALVAVAVVMAIAVPGRDRPALVIAGRTVLAAGVCGGAAAALVLLANYEIGALVILLIYVMVYDASDYVVGSGAISGIEGPLAGAVMIVAFTTLFAVTEVPPFRGADVWGFAVLVALACPAGQLLASAMLPRADAPAPALRRLDSLLVVAPVWAGLIGLYLQNSAG